MAAKSTPEILTNETVGALVAELIRLGTARFREQSAERGTSTIDEAVARSGDRAVAELVRYHDGAA